MSRPHILTEAQLRAAVAVAEARADYDESIARLVALAAIRDDKNRTPIERGIAFCEHEDTLGASVTLSRRMDELSRAYRYVRPAAPFEVRAGETLARIVADHTDGGTETASRSRDTMLVEILREFDGLEVRDGAR